MERIAKYAFQKTQDPMDAAIFYLGNSMHKFISIIVKNNI